MFYRFSTCHYNRGMGYLLSDSQCENHHQHMNFLVLVLLLTVIINNSNNGNVSLTSVGLLYRTISAVTAAASAPSIPAANPPPAQSPPRVMDLHRSRTPAAVWPLVEEVARSARIWFSTDTPCFCLWRTGSTGEDGKTVGVCLAFLRQRVRGMGHECTEALHFALGKRTMEGGGGQDRGEVREGVA